MTDRHAPEGAVQRASDPAQDRQEKHDPTDHLSGRVLDNRYLIGSRIARGGMATVYEANDLRLDRTVAVKVMHPGLGDDDEFAARFVAEARSAAKLSHPNVVGVFDQGNDDGTVFLAMELIPGHTLRDTIGKEAPLKTARALALLEPIVSALAAAHRAGLVHRDVKPENVLISDDGRVKVADFGLAKAVSATTQHTATGVLIGTVSYVAPELVVEGRSDARADVYAVGVILYELLTGKKPHEGETPIQVAYKHVHEDVPPPSRMAPGVPDYVDALVARATARDREQRPADAGVLLHHLRRVKQAVAAGVPSDTELVEDLMPRKTLDTTEVLVRQGPAGGGTVPESWQESDLEALLGPRREVTSTIERPREPTTVTERPRPVPPSTPPSRPAKRPRRRRRGPILLILALLLAAAVGTGAWYFGYARYTTTPAVLNLSQDEAQTKLEDAGLDVKVGEPVYSDAVDEGLVVSTDPTAGQRVLKGTDVTIVMSKGRAVAQLPKLTGITVDEAQDRIQKANMAFGKATEKFSETVPAGIVIASDPKEGSTLRFGTVVDLVVSKGRRPIPVGSWVGKSATDAEKALKQRGLKVDVSHQYSDSVSEGLVISQDPKDGTLFKNDTVQLLVSLGPQLVEVPDVVAQGVDDATAALQAAGFDVDVAQAPGYIGLGYVFSMDPGAGTEIPKGSTVIIYLV
ncbi:MAG TPA: Stk1 family PASTA domain-containing Ser/Thr kinase [Nocardioides sp.]|uniref:Stk1 family PASTA domain-containing Ser/Thr kinase n=1 Tax=Nocardioides sp. TaxID=35761 RepID=UPI002E3015DC|nr:Stk1 family PASTA domain-containing Ser/Thr kinase [Nocardioides sp.]HEX5086482.1 Stk1 family PASTA domain-containing Ser/Thr kinase [Nocardioides sp.]